MHNLMDEKDNWKMVGIDLIVPARRQPVKSLLAYPNRLLYEVR